MFNMLDREIFNDDGLHPSEYGHHVMAQVLMKNTYPIFSTASIALMLGVRAK